MDEQTGFLLPQTVISNGATTSNKWTNPNNILLLDGDVTESNPGQIASDIIVGNFDFNVPVGATILGIEVQIFGYSGQPTSPAITLSLNALDNTSGEDIFYPYTSPISDLTQELALYTLGTSTYLFDTTWTVDMINNLKLQLVASGDVYVDAILCNVLYSVPVTPTPPTPGVGCPDCNSPIQAQPFYLALPFLSTDIKCYLKSFNYPDGSPIEYADLGACGGGIDLIFDPAVPKTEGSNFEENAVTSSWTVLKNGTVEIDFVTLANRGLQFHTPYEHEDNLLSDHDINSKVIIGNSAHFYSRFTRECSLGTEIYNEIVPGSVNTFTLVNIPVTGTVRVYANRMRLYPITDYTINYTTGVITTVASYNAEDLLADYSENS